jgi:rRNA maturation endonuclease Nob1
MTKQLCNKCKKIFKNLTEIGLCAFCYLELNNKWAKEFSEPYKKNK